jgi:hypothetical protein
MKYSGLILLPLILVGCVGNPVMTKTECPAFPAVPNWLPTPDELEASMSNLEPL